MLRPFRHLFAQAKQVAPHGCSCYDDVTPAAGLHHGTTDSEGVGVVTAEAKAAERFGRESFRLACLDSLLLLRR